MLSCRTWEYSFLSPKLMDCAELFYSTDMKMSHIKSSGAFEKRWKPKNSLTSLLVIFLFLECVIFMPLMSQSEPRSVTHLLYKSGVTPPCTDWVLHSWTVQILLSASVSHWIRAPCFFSEIFGSAWLLYLWLLLFLWLTQRINTSKITVYQLTGEVAHFSLFDL